MGKQNDQKKTNGSVLEFEAQLWAALPKPLSGELRRPLQRLRQAAVPEPLGKL